MLDTLPLDDIKESLVALSENEEVTEKLLNYKFKNGRLANLNFNDLYFTAMQDLYKDFTEAVKQSQNVFK